MANRCTFISRLGRVALLVALAVAARAQYPGALSRPDAVEGRLRSIAVLEWVGDEGKPKGCRLVPVALLHGDVLEDASVYMARPQPMAVSGNVEYQLEQEGKLTGLFEIDHAGQEQGSWVGYGKWRTLPKPKAKPSMKDTAKMQIVDAESDRPVLHRKKHPEDEKKSGPSGEAGGTADDKPKLHRKSDDQGDAPPASSSKTTAADSDPDRPTLHRKSADEKATAPAETPAKTQDGATAKTTGSGKNDADPDRPKLKKANRKKAEEENFSEAVRGMTDPERPHLRRGLPAADGVKLAPTMLGMPEGMRQQIAVSDASDRPEHLWKYVWADAADEAKMKAELEEVARAALGLKPLADSAAAPLPSAAPLLPSAPVRNAKGSRSGKVAPVPVEPPAPEPLMGELFRSFELTYGAGATLVLYAHTDAEVGHRKHVTLIAQPDLYGHPLLLLKSVTEDAHLDERPLMRLIDVVDAMADNRGELLFELRGASGRQFALYRVLRGEAEELFKGAGGDFYRQP